LFGNALVEAADIGDRQRAAQRQGDERIAWLRAHRGQVAEVDRDQPPTERPKIEPRPLQPKIDLFNHGVGRRHDESIAAPDRGIIGRRGNQQRS
jgi:hypothetical protein